MVLLSLCSCKSSDHKYRDLVPGGGKQVREGLTWLSSPTHPERLDEVHVHVDERFVAEDDQSVVGPTETVNDPNADAEVLVIDLVNIQQPHGELDDQRAPSGPERKVNIRMLLAGADNNQYSGLSILL